jgi:hypothetical protein
METARLQKEIRDLRAESITIVSEYMYLTKQAEIQDLSDKKNLGLEKSEFPPVKIYIKKKED